MAGLDAAHTPVIASVGQSIERQEIVTPVDLAERAARVILDDVPRLGAHIDRLTMVSVSFSPVAAAPSTQIAARLGLGGAQCEVTTPGGHTPQWAVTRAAAEIANGQLDATLIVGAEATRSMRASRPGADFLDPSSSPNEDSETSDTQVGLGLGDMLSRSERAAGLMRPAEIYPIIESALAHAAGRSPAEQRQHVGDILARFTRVAAENPYAWFREKLEAAQIATPSADNRLTAEPYTKRMNSFPNVDVGSALLVCSLEVARAAGAGDTSVFVWGGATNTDGPPSERSDLGASAAIRAASQAIFAAARMGIDDVGLFDLYSAFPSAFQVAAAALGIATDDSRGLTVTGGMPFFGGPGNNYSSHAIASLVEKLRLAGGLGLIAANGGYLSKHSLGLYGTSPPPHGFHAADTAAAQARIEDAAPVSSLEATGEARVEGGTVVYARDGSVASAPVIARLDDGRRIVAQAESSLLAELAGQSLVGRRILVAGSPILYRL
ncbi:MAG: acetyl-CoA acetyltransferase [Myxococcales bacterium]|nr:acetyl-CoA acetyltransferase [Myxococcales bacterium]